jgi:argininosuccinate lyase
MKRAIDESFIQALDLAELLVQDYNIPFRQSHNIVAQLVKNSEKSEDMFSKEKIEKYIFKILNKKITLSENLIQILKNLDLCLEKRISQGSPANNEVKINIEELNKSKEIIHKLYLKRIEKIGKADALRKEIIKDLQSSV